MSKSIAISTILGNVGKDPDIRQTTGGTTVAQFSIATSRSIKDANGNWTEKTVWHNLKAFGKTAEVVRDYVRKGSKVMVMGDIDVETWEKDGQRQYKSVVIVSNLTLLDGKRDQQAGDPPSKPFQSPEINDCEIPF